MSDWSYLVLLEYFELIIKKYKTLADKPLIQRCVNKVQNRATFNLKSGYDLKLLTAEAIKLLQEE